jgi:hypothetical protein
MPMKFLNPIVHDLLFPRRVFAADVVTARRAVIAFAIAFHVVSLPGSAQDNRTRDVPPAPIIPMVTGDSLVSFVSDSQSPIFFETLWISSNNNDKAREMIYSQILADRPNGVFHLGDMISIGFYQATWRSTDAFLDRARDTHIPVFATLGNHEVMLFPSYGVEQFYERFPWYRKTGYAVRAGKLTVVLLNSNFNRLSDQEQMSQRGWLDSTLTACEYDTTVGAVIVACHHPPFTNSTIVSPSKEVRESFVPLYLRYAKCVLFLSGHCHAVEHFRQDGKDFLVIGGGGGLQQPLLTGNDVRWEDHFPLKTEKRMFHYVQCRITGQVLEVKIRMVKRDFSGFEDAYTLSFPFIQSTRP